MGNTQYLSIIKNKEEGSTPQINLDDELKNGKFILDCINKNIAKSVHDIGEGGLLVAAAEMCIAGNQGIKIRVNKDFLHGYFFGEDQGRYLLEISDDNFDHLSNLASNTNIFVEKLASINEKNISINDIGSISLNKLKASHLEWFKNFTDE